MFVHVGEGGGAEVAIDGRDSERPACFVEVEAEGEGVPALGFAVVDSDSPSRFPVVGLGDRELRFPLALQVGRTALPGACVAGVVAVEDGGAAVATGAEQVVNPGL